MRPHLSKFGERKLQPLEAIVLRSIFSLSGLQASADTSDPAFPPGGDALVCAAEDGDGEVLVDVSAAASAGGDA